MKRASLLCLDPELGEALSLNERRSAEAKLLVPTITLPRGPWEAPTRPPRRAELGLLVLEGQLVREVIVDRARGLELLGEGDLVRPWQEDACSFCFSSWRVLQRTRLAVLDDRFAAALAEWPALMVALLDRSLRRSRFLAVGAAVSNLVGVERRVLTLLWQLSERWGRVEDGVVVVTARLTHQLIAELIGSRRPSVTQALGRLVAAGEVESRGLGYWALPGQPPAAVIDEARRVTAAA